MKKLYFTGLGLLVVLSTGCSNEFETGFKKICRDSGMSRRVCRCMIQQLNATFGRDNLNQAFINDKVNHEEFANSMDEAGQQCLYQELK
ncbi:hypothetical protein [Acinetobacter soli]|uniref:hypothetical protein n=1 Tax=Acinetobacter soli TaxID=487316 RepID=UPI00370B215E